MVKRKLETSEPVAKVSKSDDVENVPNDERKEKLVPFDFDEEDCDIIIEAIDKKVHVPSTFLEMATNGNDLPFSDERIAINVSSESLIEALSFYVPKSWKGDSKYRK